MSYDLMVFDANVAPRDREEFLAWYRSQASWSEPHDYNDPSVTADKLKAWYGAITQEFPNMNGPEALTWDVADERWDGASLTDYSIGKSVIYAAFRWSQAEHAYDRVRALAVTAGVGFYDVSGDEGDGEIWIPGSDMRPPQTGTWRQVASDFRDIHKRP